MRAAARPSRARIVATFVLAALALALGWWIASLTYRVETDRGVVSTMAIVAPSYVEAVVGDVNVLGISPQSTDDGRISVWAAIGSAGAAETPASTLTTRPDPEDRAPTSEQRRGVVMLVGGDAAPHFASCAPELDLSIWTGIAYADLSPVEQAAVVESISVQLEDRQAQYGRADRDVHLSAIDSASAMSFTLLEVPEMTPGSWTMSAAPEAETTVDETEEQTETVYGYTTFFQCDVPLSAFWTRQSAGARFELPALVVTAAAGDRPMRAESRIGIYREKELSTFTEQNASGLAGASYTESWPGLTGQRIERDAYSDAQAVASVNDISVSYSSSDASSLRDAEIFLAGVALSLFASSLVAGIKQLAARRRKTG
jgi:hypothetical protein